MYKCLTVDLFNLHIPMALNANSFGFHIVSHKYIYSYAIFHDYVEQFHDAMWVGVNSDWMSNCCMNGRNLWIVHIPSSSPILDVPTLFSNLGKSQIILVTCLFWSSSWVEMLTAKADFPIPGDPLIQIILWLLVFLTLVSIACRMSLRMPSIITCTAWASSPQGHSPNHPVPSSLQLYFHFMI